MCKLRALLPAPHRHAGEKTGLGTRWGQLTHKVPPQSDPHVAGSPAPSPTHLVPGREMRLDGPRAGRKCPQIRPLTIK